MVKIIYDTISNGKILERALNGDSHAQIVLSYKLYFGLGIETNKKDSKKFCLQSCESGNINALGFKLFIGWKTEIDLEESLKFFCEYKRNEENEKNEDYSYALNMIGFFFF